MNAIISRLHISSRAAAFHLGVSVAIALLAIALIFLVWYPGALASMQGVSRLVLILIGVDVVLGPLITLIVFNPAKKHLWFDLMVIASLQTAALLYGLQAISAGRPAYVVYNVDRYSVVPEKDVDLGSLERARVRGDAGISWFGPRTVAARLPRDLEARNKLMFSAVSGGPDLAQLPEWYVPVEEEKEQMRGRLRPMEELRKLNELDEAAWSDLLAQFGKPADQLGYFPMDANARDGAMIVDRATLDPLGIRLLQPKWGGEPRAVESGTGAEQPKVPPADRSRGLS